MPRRSVTISRARVADRYAGSGEAIAEVSSRAVNGHPARGCLVSVRQVENAGRGARGLIIEVYRADPGVFVRINGRDYRAAK